MGLFDSILGAVGGNNEPETGRTSPLVGVVGQLLAQSGGLQGLMNKFSQAGHGNAFSSWVGTGENQPVSGEVIQKVIGSEQVSALAAKLGIDPAQAAQMLAQYLPQIVDKLTPAGQIDPASDHPAGLAGLLPSLLRSFGGSLAGSEEKPPGT